MRLMPSILALSLLTAANGSLAGTIIDTYASTVNNVAILPDNGCLEDSAAGTGLGGISNQITIPAGDLGSIEDINVQVQMNHTWRSDIQASLTDGTTTVLLANNHDGSGDNYFATFDSQSAALCSAAANCGTAGNCAAAPGPTCQPDQALDAFNGLEAADRTFTLNICDRAAGDLGTLLNWTMEVERTPPATSVSGTYPSTVNNVPILPDNGCLDDGAGTGGGGITNQITIPAGDVGSIVDVDVQVQMTHTWRSDIQMALSDGTNTVIMANNHDGSGDNYFATFDSQGADLCSAAANCGTAGNCTAAPGPICQPNQSFDAFNGAEAAGRTFTLSVCDRAGGDLGTLLNWTLLVDREIGAEADLDLTKVATTVPSPVLVGSTIVYQLTANNAGPADAAGVVVTDTLPTQLDFVSTDCGAGFAGQTLTWNIGALPNGGNAVCNLTVQVAETGAISNTASISSDTNDPNPANDASTAVVGGAELTDMAVVLTSNAPGGLTLGDGFVYTVTGTNNGPGTAFDIDFSLDLSPNLGFVSSNCGAVPTGNTLNWSVASLANGASSDCQITVLAVLPGTIESSAAVSSVTFDPDLINNSDTLVLSAEAVPVPTNNMLGLLLLAMMSLVIGMVALRRG